MVNRENWLGNILEEIVLGGNEESQASVYLRTTHAMRWLTGLKKKSIVGMGKARSLAGGPFVALMNEILSHQIVFCFYHLEGIWIWL